MGASIVPLMRAALDAARRRVDRFTLALAALSVLGAGLVLAREVTYGVAPQWDGVAYISTARNLLDGQGFIRFNDWTYLNQPPLYPLLLAALSFGVFDPFAVAGPLNAVLFGLTIFAAGCCLRRWVRNRLLLVWGCAAVALSLPLAAMAYEALSEPLFILCLTLSLLYSVRYFEQGRRSALLWAAAFAALALLTRYAGVTLIMLMAPLLALLPGVAVGAKARRLGLYLAIALLPVAVWLLRNYLTFGVIRALSADHTPQKLGQTLQQYLGELSGWVFLPAPPGGFGVAAMALAAAFLAALALVAAAAAIRFLFYPKAGRAGDDRGRWIGCGVFGGFGLIYFAFVVSAVAREGFMGGSDRYLASAYVPLTLAAAVALDLLLGAGIIRRLNRTNILNRGGVKQLALMIAVALFVSWLAQSAALHARAIDEANAYGKRSRYDPQWTQSETLRYAEQHLAEATLFTYKYRELYLYTDLENYRLIPGKFWQSEDELAGLDEDAYLIWPGTSNTARLLLLPGLEVAAALSDGFIFRYRPADDEGIRPPTPAWHGWLAADGPAARAGGFDLYLTEHRLVYVKEPCAAEDVAGWFYLNIYPTDAADLPEYWRGRGQEHQGFVFGHYGKVRDGRCLAVFPLPDYGIARLEVGQRNPRENWQAPVWQAGFPAYTEERAADWPGYYARLTAGKPAGQANGFEVYLGDGELVYAKEPCTAADTAAPFFRYIVPRDPAEFPEWEQEQGYDWREFGFADYGAMFDGKCLAVLPITTLPAYRIARIQAGQHTGMGPLWEVDFPAINGGTAGHWRRWHKRTANGAPAAASDFAVYLGEGELLYAKAPCAVADTEATFFLHLIPQNLDDLPEWRRGHDFDNLDFEFGPNGAVFDGRCLAAVPLPEYPLSRIRTGQYVPEAGAVWEVEFAVGE